MGTVTGVSHRIVFAGGLAVLLTLTTVLASCGDDGDDAAADPPWCLSDIELPDDAEAIEATLAAMPEQLAGQQRQLTTSPDPDVERIEVYYEEALEGTPSLWAVNIEPMTTFLDAEEEPAALEVMEIMLEAATDPVDPGGTTVEIEEVSMDPDADLVWATGDSIEVGETPAEDIRGPSMMFADPDGGWIFNIVASTPELRVELVEAFCDAAS